MTTIAASKIATIGATIGATLPDGAVDPILDPDNPDLIAMWTMDNVSGPTILDESSNSYDMTATNVSFPTGQIGNAVRCDLDTEHVRSTISGLLTDATSDSVSVCGWVFNDLGLSTANQRIFALQDSTVANNILQLRIVTGGDFFEVVTNINTNEVWRSAVNLVDDTWNFFVVQKEAGVRKLYLAAISENLTLNLGSGTRWFGSYSGIINKASIASIQVSGVTDGQGVVDQLRIFNRALTQPEIDVLFDEGTP
jgi:hypothetical protein